MQVCDELRYAFRFLIFNKLDKLPLFAVEVDGYQYHKDGTVQVNRDKMKNKILKEYNILLLRFSANEPGERNT